MGPDVKEDTESCKIWSGKVEVFGLRGKSSAQPSFAASQCDSLLHSSLIFRRLPQICLFQRLRHSCGASRWQYEPLLFASELCSSFARRSCAYSLEGRHISFSPVFSLALSTQLLQESAGCFGVYVIATYSRLTLFYCFGFSTLFIWKGVYLLSKHTRPLASYHSPFPHNRHRIRENLIAFTWKKETGAEAGAPLCWTSRPSRQ
ncbi:unnamed protein product, partial [Phaeothamnion confervicola]